MRLKWYNVIVQVPVGTLIFSSYVGSGPAFTVHPKTYQEFQAPQNILKF